MDSLPIQLIARTLTRTIPVLFIVSMLIGCDESYPPDLRYGVRTDPIVDKAPTDTPPYLDRPGQFPILAFASLSDPAYPLRTGMNQFSALDPMKLSSGDRDKIGQFLDKNFGTPAKPKVDGVDAAISGGLKIDPATLEKGSVLYRRHCLHCHGTSGDGRGPTAPWVNPHPRDYRQGLFKFTSCSLDAGVRKPLREDLVRTIRMGLEGTSMPAFNLLTDEEIDPLVSYVIHLSIRGETELETMKQWLGNSKPDGAIEETMQGALAVFGQRWLDAQTNQIVPLAYPYASASEEEMRASVVRGFQAFLTPGDASCIGCHENYGRQGPYRFDAWGTLVRPANLTQGFYRGGRRPLDLFWRIKGGIAPAGMPQLGQTLDEATSRNVWDIVNFLQVLPYKELRDKYGVQID